MKVGVRRGGGGGEGRDAKRSFAGQLCGAEERRSPVAESRRRAAAGSGGTTFTTHTGTPPTHPISSPSRPTRLDSTGIERGTNPHTLRHSPQRQRGERPNGQTAKLGIP